MTVIDVRSNADLVRYLEELEKSTTRFFDSRERSVKGLGGALVQINADLEFNERMCERIASSFKYFKGVFEGNGHTINVSSTKATSLFSSIYYSVIRNIRIHNVIGSRGLLLADDLTDSTVTNVQLTGNLYVEESIGGFARTTQGTVFEDCAVDLIIRSTSNDTALEQVSTDPIHFGGYVGVDLGNTTFVNCTVSGKIVSEVSVGGFCAASRKSKFLGCKAINLEIVGRREVGLYVGRGSQFLTFENCKIENCNMSAVTYLGFLIGRTSGALIIDKLESTNSFINPVTASSYVGGITGSADKIELTNSLISGGVSASFILAGVCPDVRDTEVTDSMFTMSLTASGYKPMMTHIYPLVRTDYLTSSNREIVFKESGNKTDIQVVELEMEGFVNPFKESIL